MGRVWNGHFACTCCHPHFLFNQVSDLERCTLRPGNVHSADGWHDVRTSETREEVCLDESSLEVSATRRAGVTRLWRM